MDQPRILVFAGSLRSGSYNRLLAREAAVAIEKVGAEVSRIDLRSYALPLYDADLEAREGLPQSAKDLHQLFATHQGIFIASPEYNANVSPLLLNTIAWVSRVMDNGGMSAAFGAPVFAIGSASPGGFGGYRGLMALRNSLELQLGARVLPQMISIGAAHEAFDDEAGLKSPRLRDMLNGIAAQLVSAGRP